MSDFEPSSLKVVELRAELSQRGLPTKGKKDELVARLTEALETEKNSGGNEQEIDEPKQTQLSDEQEQVVKEQSVIDTAEMSRAVAEQSAEQLNEKSSEQVVDTPTEQVVNTPTEQVIEKPTGEVAEIHTETVIKQSSDKVSNELEEQVVEKHQEQVVEKPQEQVIETPQEQVIEKSQEQTIENQTEAMDSEADSGPKRKRLEVDSIQDDKRLKTCENEEDSTEALALYVKGFVRPLIIKHAQELFAKYGTVKRFWMDSIKTHCYVTYETKLQAKEAFTHINGIKFPADTGRLLTVGELTSEQADTLIEYEQNAAEKRIKIDWEAMINKAKAGQALSSMASPNNDDGSRRFRSIGMGQITKQLAQAAEPISLPAVAKTSPAITKPRDISLDDLFRKTKALPQLYYLPNTDQEAKLKLEKLSQH